jgi:hypothetical protein
MSLRKVESGESKVERRPCGPTLEIDIPSEGPATLDPSVHQKSRNKPGMLLKTNGRMQDSGFRIQGIQGESQCEESFQIPTKPGRDTRSIVGCAVIRIAGTNRECC